MGIDEEHPPGQTLSQAEVQLRHITELSSCYCTEPRIQMYIIFSKSDYCNIKLSPT